MRALPLALLAAVLCAACTGPRLLDDRLQERYAAAVRDAETADPDEVITRLLAVTPATPGLQWTGTDDARRLLVSTWTGYPPDAAPGDTMTLTRETWVTLVPEVRDFCRGLGLQGDRLALRLNQRIGLPPAAGKTHFVEYWVDPDDLFRPCPDPEITDRECGLDFPQPARAVTVAPDHVAWIEALTASSYGTDGYPWTRLGYTYDWGNPDDVVGASEFVLRPGAHVALHTLETTEAYCH